MNAPAAMADVETASDDYARRFRGTAGQWLLDVQETIVMRLLAGRSGLSVLDVGGGHGQIARPLARAGHRVTVAASADEGFAQIRDLIAAGTCEARVTDLLTLPFPDKSFDVVTCFRLLPHCDQWQRLIAELCRVASHTVIADYPTTQSINALTPLLFGAKKKIEGNTRTYTLFSHGQITDAFEQAHFKCSRRCGEFFLPMVIHRVLKQPLLSHLLEAPWRALRLTDLFGSPVIVKMDRRKK